MATGNYNSNSEVIYVVNTCDDEAMSNITDSIREHIQSEYNDEDFFFTDEVEDDFHSIATLYSCENISNGEGYEYEFCVNMKIGYRYGHYDHANLDYKFFLESVEDNSADFETVDALTDDIIKYPETYDLDDSYEFQIKVDKKVNSMIEELDKFVSNMLEKHSDQQLVCTGHMSNGAAVYQ